MTEDRYMTENGASHLWQKFLNKLQNLKVNHITIGNTKLTEEQLIALLQLLDKGEQS